MHILLQLFYIFLRPVMVKHGLAPHDPPTLVRRCHVASFDRMDFHKDIGGGLQVACGFAMARLKVTTLTMNEPGKRTGQSGESRCCLGANRLRPLPWASTGSCNKPFFPTPRGARAARTCHAPSSHPAVEEPAPEPPGQDHGVAFASDHGGTTARKTTETDPARACPCRAKQATFGVEGRDVLERSTDTTNGALCYQ